MNEKRIIGVGYVDLDDLKRTVDLRTIFGDEKILCPWHDDSRPSLHVYPDHVYCFSCWHSADGIELLRELYDLEFSQAVKMMMRYQGKSTIQSQALGHTSRRAALIPVEELNEAADHLTHLPKKSETWKYLANRGIMRSTADILHLGWNGRKYSIPHFVNGKIVNCKFRVHPEYQMDGEPKYNSLSGRLFGKPYPWDHFNTIHAGSLRAIFVTEGEFDCMQILQIGLPCVSLPSGAGTRLEKWPKFWKRFGTLLMLYDQDAAGTRAWKKAVKTGLPVQRVKWNKKRGKDVTNARNWLLPRLERLYAKTMQ